MDAGRCQPRGQLLLAAGDHSVKDSLCVERMGWFFAPAEHQQILVLLHGKRLLGYLPLPTEQVALKKRVHRLAARLVVVVRSVYLHLAHFVPCPVKSVNRAHRRELNLWRVRRPVASTRDQQQGSRRHAARDFHIVDVQPQVPLILTATAALHKGRDHVDGSRRFDPLVNRHQQKGLRPPTGRARAAYALGIYILQ